MNKAVKEQSGFVKDTKTRKVIFLITMISEWAITI